MISWWKPNRKFQRALAVNSFKYLHSTNHIWNWIEKDYSYWMAIEKIVKGNAISSASELRCQSSVEKGVSWSMPSFDRTWWKFCDKLTEWKNQPLIFGGWHHSWRLYPPFFLFVLWDQRYILQYLIQVGMIVWRLLVLKLIFYETRWTPLAKRNLDVPGWVSRQHLLRIADWTEQAVLHWPTLMINTHFLIKRDPIIFAPNLIIFAL